jgi:GNAT superfamily N-acetyltransferase
MRLIPWDGAFTKAAVCLPRAPLGRAPFMNSESSMPSDLQIHSVTRQDYDQWLPLWDGYNAFYGRSGATALGSDITRTTWARFFDADEPVHGLVAESDGRLLGLTHYLFHRSTIAIEPVCYLQDLFTGEAARGKGVGRALIDAVYRQAKIAGSPRVYWQTHATNLTARKLYDEVAEHSGFVVYRKLL